MTAHGERMPRSFWIGLALGIVPMAWGVWLYLDATPDLTRRLDLAKWLIGLDLLHDLVLAPLAVGLGFLVARWVPRPARAAVQVALIGTGTVLLVGWLPLVGSSEANNPTIQPLDYGPSIVAVIAAIWVTTALVTVVRARGRSSGGSGGGALQDVDAAG